MIEMVPAQAGAWRQLISVSLECPETHGIPPAMPPLLMRAGGSPTEQSQYIGDEGRCTGGVGCVELRVARATWEAGELAF
jgi:hypothetical protein